METENLDTIENFLEKRTWAECPHIGPFTWTQTIICGRKFIMTVIFSGPRGEQNV